MTTPTLSDLAPNDVEETLIAWLSPLRRTAITRRAGDPLPFTLVRQIGGEEGDTSIDCLVSVRTLCDKAGGELVAARECSRTHRRMLLLARTLESITLPDGTVVGLDYVKTFEPPHWSPFDDDQILCKLARYDIGLTFTRHPA